ncbi:hypothetical protein [Plantactinospora sp. B24E8]|uniref:hypothetical protein n=1 Tax=Plantactinospora sp. B24E8 TaxID=3153567 RepID=UPI00325F4684
MWVYYGTMRTVTVAGIEIRVRKIDGPEIGVKWYQCSNRNVQGSVYILPNHDPTGWVTIGHNLPAKLAFCLAAEKLRQQFDGHLDRRRRMEHEPLVTYGRTW